MSFLTLLRSYCSYAIWAVLCCSYSSYGTGVSLAQIGRESEAGNRGLGSICRRVYMPGIDPSVLYSYEFSRSYMYVATTKPLLSLFMGGRTDGR